MVRVSAFTLNLIDEAKIDFSVGGEPQIFVIPNEGATKELDYDEIKKELGLVGTAKDVMETILKL